MGTDIHVCVEKRMCNRWEAVTKTSKYDEEGLYWLDIGRCYALFAILANVRNGYGFAGCDTGDGFKPISSPRDLPADASAAVKDSYDEGWDHSISWLTLQELLDYDWTQTTKLRGWVDAVTYYKWDEWARRRGEGPREYCGSIDGMCIKHITPEEMDTEMGKIKQLNLDYRGDIEAIKTALESTYCQVEWGQPYYKCCREFLSEVIPQLLKIGKPEDVRIVFWFDS